MLRPMARSAARQIWLIGLGTAVVPLDTAVNIAFPAIAQSFDLAIGDIQWVVIAYVMTYAALMLALGRIGDIFGHARVFRAGLAWSAIALLTCAFAPNFAMLLACRFLQGIGAALVLSCGPALATGLYGEDRRSRVLGIYTMTLAIGSALGPLVGGALVQWWDWPAVFWFRVPVAAAVLVLLRGLPAPPADVRREPFDLAGAGLLALALVTMLLAFNRIPDIAALPLGLTALAAAAAFVRHEGRCEKPILDLQVLRLPGFAAINLANVLTNLAAFAVWLLVPFYLARTDFTLSAGGAVLATAWLGAMVSSGVAGRLIGPLPAGRLALAGAVMVGIGLWLIASWDGATPAGWLIAALMVQGFGLGLFQLAYTDIVTGAIPRENRGVAGSLAMVTRTVGVVGAASLVMLVFRNFEATVGFLAAFRKTFDFAAALALATALLLAWRAGR